jgi:hypothetical protein
MAVIYKKRKKKLKIRNKQNFAKDTTGQPNRGGSYSTPF